MDGGSAVVCLRNCRFLRNDELLHFVNTPAPAPCPSFRNQARKHLAANSANFQRSTGDLDSRETRVTDDGNLDAEKGDCGIGTTARSRRSALRSTSPKKRPASSRPGRLNGCRLHSNVLDQVRSTEPSIRCACPTGSADHKSIGTDAGRRMPTPIRDRRLKSDQRPSATLQAFRRRRTVDMRITSEFASRAAASLRGIFPARRSAIT